MKRSFKVIIILLLVGFVMGGVLVSCRTEPRATVDENDLDIILRTLSVFDQNYYALTKFESDGDYVVEKIKNSDNPNEEYRIKLIVNTSAMYKTIYVRTKDSSKITLNDWDINDFSLSPAWPTSVSNKKYFEDKNVEIDGTFKRADGDNGSTIFSTIIDDLKIKFQYKSYEVVFSYFVDMSTYPNPIATASLFVDDMDYSSELKNFLESVYGSDIEGDD